MLKNIFLYQNFGKMIVEFEAWQFAPRNDWQELET